MNYSDALEALEEGLRVKRAGWNGKGVYLFLVTGWSITQSPVPSSKIPVLPLLSFIAMKTADGAIVPWLASQTDMLAEDWAESD